MGALGKFALACVAVLPLAAAAATHTVNIEGMKFVPETITVKKGDHIVWKNKDVVPHTATATGSFDSKSIAPGASWKQRVGKAGEYDVVCRFHPGMKAKLVVQ
jgi:plastocyanin